MTTPSPWVCFLLFGGAFRIYRLLAKDTILDGPRGKLVRLSKDWSPGSPIPKEYREKLATFLVCPWCLGFWICLAWWGAWQAWPHAITVASVPLTISAAIGMVAKLDADD